MTQFLSLLKVEFKNKISIDNSANTILRKILYLLKSLLKIALIVVMVVIISNLLINWSISNSLEVEFLIFAFSAVFVFLFFSSLNGIIKTLQESSASRELLSMPISSSKIFFVKLAYFYLKQLIVLALVALPLVINWGVLTLQGTYFYVASLLILAIIPIVPLFFAIVLSFPTNIILGFLKNRFFISFFIMAVVVAGSFYLYSNFLKFLLNIVDANVSSLTLEMISNVQIFASSLYLPVLFKNILINSNLWKSALVVLTITLVCILGTYLIAKKAYSSVLQNSALNQVNLKKNKTKIKNQNVFWLLIKKEFLTVYRISNYSFSFFTIGMVTPIIVFFFNSLLIDLEVLQTNMYPAISLFIILIFMALLTSFSATTITREGVNFAFTKTIPINAKKQVFAKIVFYLIVEIPSVVASGLILYLTGFIGPVDLVIIAAISSIFVYGGISNAINIDIKNPRFNYLKNNIAVQNNPNISKNVYGGLALSFVFGTIGIVLSFFVSNFLWYLPIAILAICYTIIQHFSLLNKIEKKYYEIES